MILLAAEKACVSPNTLEFAGNVLFFLSPWCCTFRWEKMSLKNKRTYQFQDDVKKKTAHLSQSTISNP